MNTPQSKSGCKFGQALIDQRPYFERRKTVESRKLGIRRPTMKKPKVKWI